MSELDKWLEKNNFFTRTKDVHVASHLLFTGYKGGNMYIPRHKDYEFLSRYAAEMEAGTKLYVVETRPKTFKFMIDADISDDHYWTTEEIAEMTAVIQKTVYAFFEINQVTICCTSPQKIKGGEIHTGIHLIWPTLFVMSDTALCIRRGVIQQLKEYKQLAKSWDQIIDESIYTRNGYRMVGSDKMSRTKVPENRPLSLLFVMDSDGSLNQVYRDRLSGSTKALVHETSIRYVIDTYLSKGMDINKFPEWLEEDPIQKKAGYSGVAGTVASSTEHLIIEKFIKSDLPRVYFGVVKAVTRYPDKNILIKTTSKYCMNIGREHNSCGIYFFASPNGMYQKCLCSCQKLDGRRNGLCMDYTSSCYEFTDHIKEQLFPNLFESVDDTNSTKPKTEDQKKKELKKQQKEQQAYKPETKTSRALEIKQRCDKLFNDTQS